MRMTLGAVVLLVGCGDPRAAFVGSYRGTAHWVYTDTGSGEPESVTFTLTAPDKSDRLQFSGGCMFTATVEDADTLQFDPVVCPPKQSSTVGGAMATFTNTYTSGTATLTGKTLTMLQLGTQLGSNYSNGGPNRTFPFRMTITATKQ